MRILVTGCSGYIGSRLVYRLKEAGHETVGIDRSSSASLPLETFVQCDLLDVAKYEHLLERVDCICHLAAAKGDWGISDDEYFRDNVHVTKVLLQAASRHEITRWIFYSTVSSLGPSALPLDETEPRRPVNAYGRSKAACEELFEDFAARTPEARVLIIRPSVVFGPGNPWNTNILRLIDAIQRGRFLMIGRGRDVKTTSYIDNLLDAHMFLAELELKSGPGVRIVHYIDEPAEDTATLVHRICRLLNRQPPSLHLPLAVASPLALIGDTIAAVAGVDLPITSARIRKFCTATNFSASAIRRLGFKQRVSNEEAFRRTVDWYLDEFVNSAKRVV